MKKILLLLLIFLQSCMITESISDSTMNQPVLSNYLDEFSKDYIVKSKEIAFRDTNSVDVITIQFVSVNKKLSVISGIGRTGGKAFLVNKGDKLQFLFTDGTVANITFEESKVSEYNINQIGYYTITHYYAATLFCQSTFWYCYVFIIPNISSICKYKIWFVAIWTKFGQHSNSSCIICSVFRQNKIL